MKQNATERWIYIVAGLIVVSWVTASVLLQILDVGLAVRLLIGVVPVALLLVQIFLAFRYTIGQDEVQRRIILEGLAIAFVVALPVIFLVGFVIKAGINLPLGFIDAGYFMEVALLVGYALAYRRYR